VLERGIQIVSGRCHVSQGSPLLLPAPRSLLTAPSSLLPPLRLATAILVVLLASAPGVVAAQTIRGVVVDATSRRPVGTGFLVLLNADSAEVARTLWSSDGRFTLRAPRGGSYRLRSERIGYRAFVTDVLQVPTTGAIEHDLAISALPVALNTVEVRGRDRCQVNPVRAAETALAWEEIRKALAAAAWEGNEQLYRFRRYTYVREVNRNGRDILREDGQVVTAVATQQYVSLTAEQLAEYGYVVTIKGDLVYYIPDVDVLLDDAFLNTHCFHVVRDPAEHAGLVGLAYEPMTERDRTEVRGILWIDESTSELRTMAVGFTEIPGRVTDDRIGGTLDFMQLPSGAWIVQRWEIRTPVLRWRGSADPAIRTRRERAAIRYFQYSGGEILEITARDGSKTYPAALAHVTGAIFDSTRVEPLAGVRVTITGTDFGEETDSRGEFHLAVPLEGDYAVNFAHPYLDSIGFTAPDQKLSLARGSESSVSFAIPPATAMIERLCGESPDNMEGKVVVGLVTAPDGDPVADAAVRASWQRVVPTDSGFVSSDFQQGALTDESGFYALCGIPVGRPVELTAEHRSDESSTLEVIFPWTADGQLLMARDRTPGAPYPESHSLVRPIWKVDLQLGDRERPGPEVAGARALQGMVADRMTGRGLEGVTVDLNGTMTTTTRPDGTFDLAGVTWAPGTNRISFRQLAYRPWIQELHVEPDRSKLVVSVLLTSNAIALDPVVVEAERVRRSRYLENQGFYRRREKGLGYHVSPERIEERRAAVADVSDFIMGMPGVTIMDLPEPIEGLSGRLLMLGHGSRRCVPNVYVDNVPYNYDGTVRDLEVIARPEDVYAIEIYQRSSEVPVEYATGGAQCVLVFWTRRGVGPP